MVVAALLAAAGFAHAEDPPAAPARAVEEIVVTAQKKEQSIQEVPISITAIEGAFLKEAGIDELHKLAEFAPNVRFTTNPCCTTVFVRGFGTPFAASAFDPAVGLALDELSIPREIYMSDPLFDIERIEVLRGPQGALFGKNTSAGLFNVVTAKPTRELTGYLSARVGTLDVHRVEGAVSGSPKMLADFAQFRLSGVHLHGPGDVENTKLDIDEPGAKQGAGRLEIALQPTSDLDILLIGSGAVTDSRVFHVQLARLSDPTLAFLRQFDPEVEDDPFNHQNSISLKDDIHRATHLAQANVRYSLDRWLPRVKSPELVAILGYTAFDQNASLDVDFSSAEILGLVDPSPFDYRQISAELRFTGAVPAPFGFGEVELLAGFLAFDANLFSNSQARAGTEFDDYLISAPGFETVAGMPPPGGLSGGQLLDLVLGSVGLDPIQNTGLLENDGARFFFDQDTRSYAGFGNVSWHPSPEWTLSLGGRFTYEAKTADLRNSCFDPGVICAALMIEEFGFERERSETDFSPKLTVQYFYSDALSLFATRAQGFKSGGYNNFSFTSDSIEVDSEEAVSYEAGAKGTLFSGMLGYGATFFNMDVEDLQLQNLTGGFVQTRNAASARSRGLEVDFRWLTPWEPLSFRGGGALTDARFKDFQDAPAIASSGATNQDLSGRRMPFVPRTQLIVTPELRFPFASPAFLGSWSPGDLAVNLALDILYRSSMFLDNDLDPNTLQDAYTKLNGRIWLGPTDGKWAASFAVDNLTDEDVLEFAVDSLVFPGAYTTFQEFQRRYTFELRYAF